MLAPERLITFRASGRRNCPPPQLPVMPFGVENHQARRQRIAKADARQRGGRVVVLNREAKRGRSGFSGMLAAPNALIMTGGATTVIEALESIFRCRRWWT